LLPALANVAKADDQLHKDILDVLLVDDNEDDIYMLREAFSQAPLVNVVCVVRDGEEALAYLRRHGVYKNAARPGLVLLDINMPKKNGFEVLQELKADPDICSIPVVMLTTSERDEDVVRCYAKGACTFISKPVDIESLRRTAIQFVNYWSGIARIPSHDRLFRTAF
jgi:CheY-like chemotaxis protein